MSHSEVVLSTESRMVIYTICENPSDYPGKHTIRRQFIESGNPEPKSDLDFLVVVDTLDMAREFLMPFGLFCVPRSPFDDKVIVESWM